MQFLWKYVDDLVGKGLEWHLVAELLFLASASMVPLALPLSVLLSSIMTLGSLGEHFELVAMKSSGASLYRILRVLAVCALLISGLAFLFADYVLPRANLEFGVLLSDIRQKRPALNVPEGVFYNGIEGYTIRVDHKSEDKNTLFDIMIYDHTQNRGASNVLYAKRGEMEMTPDKNFLIVNLFDGSRYEELDNNQQSTGQSAQVRMGFDKYTKYFDLSEFRMTRTSTDIFKSNYQMLNNAQLEVAMDTIRMQGKKIASEMKGYIDPYFNFTKRNQDSLGKLLPAKIASNVFAGLKANEKPSAIGRALGAMRSAAGYSEVVKENADLNADLFIRHQIEWWRKITYSLACFVLFLVGAPLGAIIRRGGLGMPVVMAIIFFVIFYLLITLGEKMSKSLILTAAQGMWLAIIILFPIGIYLCIKSANDSILFNPDTYFNVFKRAGRFFTRNILRLK